MPLLI
ncbi:hypothetical protein D047_0062A, partial [Vibrio parahaemolyticus VPTS-2010_2]